MTKPVRQDLTGLLQNTSLSAILILCKKRKIKKKTDTIIEKMFQAGAHYGYSKTRRHPSVSSYIYATKNKGDIINLEKTSILLDEATEFIKNLGAQNKIVLCVGTKPEAKVVIKDMAESLNMPFVIRKMDRRNLEQFYRNKKENHRIGKLPKR